MQPFAVVGSRTQVGFGEKKVRARQYPWGLVEVENDKHCDFVHLRELLVRKHIVDLVQSTHQRHYMTYRAETMESKGFVDKDDENIAKAFEEKKKAFEEEMKLAEETMRQRFISKVQSKEALLKNKQQEVSTHATRTILFITFVSLCFAITVFLSLSLFIFLFFSPFRYPLFLSHLSLSLDLCLSFSPSLCFSLSHTLTCVDVRQVRDTAEQAQRGAAPAQAASVAARRPAQCSQGGRQPLAQGEAQESQVPPWQHPHSSALIFFIIIFSLN